MKSFRSHLVLAGILLLGAAIVGRLFSLQIKQHDLYQAWAQGQQKFFASVSGSRGEISFAGGEKLATNSAAKFVYLAPDEVKDKEKTKNILEEVLGLDGNELQAKLAGSNSYELLKDKLSNEEIDWLERLDLPGVHLSEETTRIFPQGELVSQTIGFVNAEDQGQYGLEGYYQNILEGESGVVEGEKGTNGFLLLLEGLNSTQKGKDLILTLDYQIQFEAEKILKQYSQDLGYKSATIIVMKPDNGEVLAVANYPNFNPNNYGQETDPAIFQNTAIQKIFEPGSVFKPLTMAAAIQEGKITPQTTYVDEGKVKIGGSTIYNFANRQYGQQTMTQVIEKSINTGAVFAEQQLGSDLFLKYLEKFGFFEKTDVDVAGEVFSENKEFKKGYEINFATASFGQGIEITPIQLIKAFCAIANGGKMANPHLVKSIIDKDGKIEEVSLQAPKSIVSSNTSSQVVSMMISVVENGFGKRAKIPGYYIAGKTGTAQVPEGGTYSSEKTIQSFIGFAPAFKPKFLILVKLDNPKSSTAEYSAVPIFHDLAKYIIDLWQIPPDYEY
jgi:cell division protein FtsI/penicillin-binding protein 2